MRLTEPAYTKIGVLLNRLRAAVELTPTEADLLPADVVNPLGEWTERLESESLEAIAELLRGGRPGETGGWLQVYAPGSRLARRGVQGVLTDIEIIMPEILSIDDGPPRLFYRYSVAKSGVKASCAAHESPHFERLENA